MSNIDLTSLEKKIGYEFKDKSLMELALTHSSYANEMKINKYGNYERLEFLGDAVLELMSSLFFYQTYPNKNEGELTRLRSSMVCEPALAFCAREFDLQDYILLGKGEESTKGRERDSIVSDVFEALLGAMYLDGGFEVAQNFVLSHVMKDLENKQLFYDAKTILQERVQQDGKTLSYVLVKEEGPDHEKQFTINALIDNKVMGTGVGKSKKSAEQQAAYQILTKK